MEETSKFKDWQWESKRPQQYALYKGVKGKNGALRFTLAPAYSDAKKKRPGGCVFVDAAPTISPNNYDWDNKIIFKLELVDIGKILLFLKNPGHKIFAKGIDPQNDNGARVLKLIHKQEATATRGEVTTTMDINFTLNSERYARFFNLSQTRDGTTRKAGIPVMPDEALILSTLLESAIPAMLAWAPC